jgi:hypothetical protein
MPLREQNLSSILARLFYISIEANLNFQFQQNYVIPLDLSALPLRGRGAHRIRSL